MKQYILTLFIVATCLLSSSIQAQNKSNHNLDNKTILKFHSLPAEFYALSEEECLQKADKLISHLDKKYKQVRHKSVQNNLYILYCEVTDNPSPRDLELVYSFKLKGANPALEIPGTKEYDFYYILGPYLDIFPLWKKYFYPESEREATSTQLTQWYELHMDSTKTIYPLFFGKSSSDGYFITNSDYRANRWQILKRNNRSRPLN